MPILKRPHNIPAVPVASQVVDDDGKLTQEFVHFLRALADLVREIQDVDVLARQSDWRPTAQMEILTDPSADKQILYNGGGTVSSDANLTWDSVNQVETVTGKTGAAAYPAIVLTDTNTPHTAYIQSDGGFNTSSTAANAIQAPSGGVYGKQLVSDTVVYLLPNSSAPPASTSTYGGLSYQNGSSYWYWNGTAFATVDLSATGGLWTSGSGGVIYYNGGNVGIGSTTIPLYSAAAPATRRFLTIEGPSDAGILELATAAADGSGILIGQLSWTNPSNSQADKRAGAVSVTTTTATTNNRGTAMLFYTRPDASAGMAERMRINDVGRLLINTSTDDGINQLQVNGATRIVGNITLTTLPSVNPGAGSKQLWYDPADGNRVKFAA